MKVSEASCIFSLSYPPSFDYCRRYNIPTCLLPSKQTRVDTKGMPPIFFFSRTLIAKIKAFTSSVPECFINILLFFYKVTIIYALAPSVNETLYSNPVKFLAAVLDVTATTLFQLVCLFISGS